MREITTVVCDDDPTGTQSASGVPVLLRTDRPQLAAAVRAHDALYVQTNSRALPERDAVELVARVRHEVLETAAGPVRFVLRGDSTLRGHVFPEIDVFAAVDGVVLFVPAFPAGGRTTRGGVHYVRQGDHDVPAGETEYARDPVFGFRSSSLVDYVAEKSGRRGVAVPLEQVREPGGLARALLQAPAGAVVVPDVVSESDVDLVHAGLLEAERAGREVLVRCGAPLAARCAGAASTGLLTTPVQRPAGPVLVVCGSHTAGATAQLAELEPITGPPVVLGTATAIAAPERAAEDVLGPLWDRLASGVAVLCSERDRAAEHGTLEHGRRVMAGLTTAVHRLSGELALVVAKGGITSAEVATAGLGAESAVVRGQILPGISLYDLAPHPVPQVVVPGNVGSARTLVEVLAATGAA